MSDTKGQHTNEKQALKTDEKKDEGQPPKAGAGTSGPGSDNTSAGSGRDEGHHHRRKHGTPEGS